MTQANLNTAAAAWPEPDPREIREFIRLLSKPREACRLRAFFPKGHPSKASDRGRKGRGDMQAIEAWQREGRGVYMVIGNGGDAEPEITSCPAFFIEHDDRPKEWQRKCWRELGLPEPTFQVDTGGRSVHSYWVLRDPMAPQAWKEIQRRLLAHAQADTSVGDIPRVMRLPGCWHMNATGQPNGMARIITSAGHRYSPEEIEACLPPLLPLPPPPPIQPAAVRPIHGEARAIEQVMDALQRIPAVLPDNGERERFRGLAWGLLCAVREAGSDDATAQQLLEAHSPQVRDAAEYLRTEPHSITAATFWRMARDAGWQPEAERRKAAQQPLQAAAASPQADAPGDATEATAAAAQTPEAKLARLGEIAADVLARRVEFAQRLPILRHHATDMGLTVRDPELLGLLTAARRQRLGTTGLLRPGDRIDMTPEPWAWQGLILRGCLNLLVALPKVGKSSLLLALISAWHYGAETFLGQPLHGPCPPVLLIGTDQGQADWGRMLHAAGLVDDAGRILSPIVGLAHAGQPVHLDAAGIDTIAEAAQQNPGLVVVVDSIQATCTAPLGLKEESPEIAMPLADLMEQLEPHGATVVAIHHASKGRAGDGPAAASRGSTALPALASQLLKLEKASEAKEDHRRLLTAEGRGGAPVALVIEKNEGGWTYCGGIEDLNRERDQEATLRKLNDRQADVLDLVGDRWREDFARTTARDVVAALGLSGKDPETSALRNLKQLERKGLLQSSRKADQWGGRGAMEFWPTADSLAHAHAGAPKNVSPVSEVSPVGEGASRVRTRIDSESATSDTSDTSDSVFQAPARGVGSVSEVVSEVQNPSDRIPCTLDGEPGWTRRAGPMGRSVVLHHNDGSQFLAGPEQVADA